MEAKKQSYGLFSAVLMAGGIEAYLEESAKSSELAQSKPFAREEGWELPPGMKDSPTAGVLWMLREARKQGKSIEMLEFLNSGFPNFSGSIARLRRRGFKIINRPQNSRRGCESSWYRLVYDPERDSK